jgi:hypothetical protein
MHARTSERRRQPRLSLDKADGLVGMVARPDSAPGAVPASIVDISRIGFRLVLEGKDAGDMVQAPVLLLEKIVGTATIRFSEPVQLAVKWLQADSSHNRMTLGCEIGRIADADVAQVARYVDAEMRWTRAALREHAASAPADAGHPPLMADEEAIEELTPMAPENDQARPRRYRLAGCLLAGLLVAAAFWWLRGPGTASDPRYPALDDRLRALEDSGADRTPLDERLQQLELEIQALGRALSDAHQAREMLTRRLEELDARLTPAAAPAAAAADPPAAPVGGTAYHTVGRGENLFRIALHHKTTVTELRAANNLQADDPIRPGQKLKLPE